MNKILIFFLITLISCDNSYFDIFSFYDELIYYHNFYRKKHSVGELSIDMDLEHLAQKTVYLCETSGKLMHSNTLYNGQTIGQNLYVSGESGLNGFKVVSNWYRESIYYDYDKGQSKYGQEIGHFSQIVWKDTTKIGCAFTPGIWNNILPSYYICCNYFPAGNIPGQYTENISRPTS